MTYTAGLPELLGLIFLAVPFVALNAISTYVAVRFAIKRFMADSSQSLH